MPGRLRVCSACQRRIRILHGARLILRGGSECQHWSSGGWVKWRERGGKGLRERERERKGERGATTKEAATEEPAVCIERKETNKQKQRSKKKTQQTRRFSTVHPCFFLLALCRFERPSAFFVCCSASCCFCCVFLSHDLLHTHAVEEKGRFPPLLLRFCSVLFGFWNWDTPPRTNATARRSSSLYDTLPRSPLAHSAFSIVLCCWLLLFGCLFFCTPVTKAPPSALSLCPPNTK